MGKEKRVRETKEGKRRRGSHSSLSRKSPELRPKKKKCPQKEGTGIIRFLTVEKTPYTSSLVKEKH